MNDLGLLETLMCPLKCSLTTGAGPYCAGARVPS